jgi:hypothetical protein
MSVRSVFGNINTPRSGEKLVYSLDGVASLSGLKIDGDTGSHLQVIQSDGNGKFRWSSVVGEPGPQGPVGPMGLRGFQGETGPEGLSPNSAFFSKDLDQTSAAAVAADSGNVPGVNYWELADEKLSFIRTATLPNSGDNKFNFYTFSSDSASLGDMAIGRFHTITSEFELDKPLDVHPFFAIYTKPKGDGTDRGSWYNSRYVILCETGKEYKLTDSDPVSTLVSTSFSQYDEILTIAIGSDSSESTIDWKFSLISMRVFLNGRVGLRGDAALVVGQGNPLLERPFNYLVFNEPIPYEYTLPSATTHLHRQVTFYNASATEWLYVVSPSDRILNVHGSDATPWLRCNVLPKSFATFVCIDVLGTKRWLATMFSPNSVFNN